MTSETIRGMTKMAILVLMAACTSSPGDPHALTACGSSYDGFMLGNTTVTPTDHCELACVPKPTGMMGGSCTAMRGSATVKCLNTTFDFGGVTGCCSLDQGSDVPIKFAECR